MTERFEACLARVLEQEGGYADHPADPGGATNLGITRRTLAAWRGVRPWWQLPKAAVKTLARPEAGRIYRGLYWNRCAGQNLPAGLDLALFDFAVNSGPERAIKALQKIVRVKADGFIGPVTLGAVRARIATAGVAGLIVALCDGRLSFLQRLVIAATFGRGWARRVAAIRSAALTMAGTDLSSTDRQVPVQPWSELMSFLSGYRTYLVAAAMAVAALAQLLGVDLPSFDGQSAGHLLMEALAIVFLRRGIKEVGSA